MPDLTPGARCAWCAAAAVEMMLIEWGRTAKKKGVVVVIEPDRYVPVCEAHRRTEAAYDPAAVRRSRASQSGAWKRRQERMF